MENNRRQDIKNKLATYLAKQEEVKIFNQAEVAASYLAEQILVENILEDEAINALIDLGLNEAINDLYNKLYQKKKLDDLNTIFNDASNPIKKLAVGKLIANKENEPIEDYLNSKTDSLANNDFLNNTLSLVKNDTELTFLENQKLAHDKTYLYKLLAALELLGLQNQARKVQHLINAPTNKTIKLKKQPTVPTNQNIHPDVVSNKQNTKINSEKETTSQDDSKQKQVLNTSNTKGHISTQDKNHDDEIIDSDAKQEPDKISTSRPVPKNIKKQEKQDNKKDKTETPVEQVLDTAKKETKKEVIRKGITWLLKWLFFEPPQAIFVWGIIIIVIIILITSTTVMECVKNPQTDECIIILNEIPKTELETMKQELSSDIIDSLDYNADAVIGSSAESFTPNKTDIQIINQGLPN